MEILDGVLDGEHMLDSSGVDEVNHRRERRGFSRTGGARDQHHTALLFADLGQDFRQHQILDGVDAPRDHAEYQSHGAALVEDVAAESSEGRHRIRQINIKVLLEFRLLLVARHDAVGHGDGVFLHQSLELRHGYETALDAGHRVVAHFQMQVGGT